MFVCICIIVDDPVCIFTGIYPAAGFPFRVSTTGRFEASFSLPPSSPPSLPPSLLRSGRFLLPPLRFTLMPSTTLTSTAGGHLRAREKGRPSEGMRIGERRA